MKPNVIVALLVGLLVGIAVGTVFKSGSPGGGGGGDTHAAAAPGGDESALTVKSGEMPTGTLDGLNEAQKFNAMKALNEVTCASCPNDTVAGCLKNHKDCAGGLKQVQQAVTLAKAGKDAAQIKAEMGGAAAPRPAAPPPETAVFKVPVDGSPVQGSADALVTMVEISDYECPFCARAHTTVEQLRKDYGDKLRVVMKQNPLPFHQNAKPAALAALAAGKQNKYWEMHNKLFENARALDGASLEKYATEIGLNMSKFKADMQSPELSKVIEQDQALASSIGASGTPAFFINGRKLSGAQPAPAFKAIIDEELAKAEALVKSGTAKNQVYAKVMETAGQAAPAAAAPQAAPSAPAPSAIKRAEAPADSPSFGPKNAKVTIVEWSDFQCPFCSRVGPSLKQIKETYGKDVRVVFRHQPLPFHPQAQIAAEASMAAHEQGKFWEYHDKLFANQGALDRPNLEKYAQELGLKMDKFKAALDTGKYTAKVKADSQAGNAVGANGTPTFFINGREFVGAQPFEAFKGIIDQEIQNADKLLASGVKPDALYEKILSNEPPPPPPVAVGTAPVKGKKDALVTIVAFSDFECPFCSRVVPTLKQIEEQYKDKVAVAFKHQPLPFHQNARPAAAASLAAHEQGKFWEYHDKLFANQRALDRASLEKYAEELGLNMGKFKAALDSNKFDAQISADSAEGSRLGANGTPTFFINGRQLVGAQPLDAFKAIIEEELAKKKK